MLRSPCRTAISRQLNPGKIMHKDIIRSAECNCCFSGRGCAASKLPTNFLVHPPMGPRCNVGMPMVALSTETMAEMPLTAGWGILEVG